MLPEWLNNATTLMVVAIGTTVLTTLGLMRNSSGGGSWVNVGKVGGLCRFNCVWFVGDRASAVGKPQHRRFSLFSKMVLVD